MEKLIIKTQHRPLLPDVKRLSSRVVAKPGIWIVVFFLGLGPALYG